MPNCANAFGALASRYQNSPVNESVAEPGQEAATVAGSRASIEGSDAQYDNLEVFVGDLDHQAQLEAMDASSRASVASSNPEYDNTQAFVGDLDHQAQLEAMDASSRASTSSQCIEYSYDSRPGEGAELEVGADGYGASTAHACLPAHLLPNAHSTGMAANAVPRQIFLGKQVEPLRCRHLHTRARARAHARTHTRTHTHRRRRCTLH